VPFSKQARASSRVLIIGSVLIPALMFVAVAWVDYRATEARAREYVVVTTDALAEQTKQALQTANLILARTLDHVDGMEWPAIDHSREVHNFLAGMVRELPLVQSIFLVDPQGFNSVSSRAFPMPAYDDRQREYYTDAKSGDDRLYVTATFLGKMTGLPGFTVSRPRIVVGRFDGVGAVTLSPAYFQSFCERIARSPRDAVAVLIRDDGRLLERYPGIAVARLPAGSPLMRALATSAKTGVFSATSKLDGVFYMVGFRRLGSQGVVASFGIARSYWLGPWYTHLAWMAAFAVLTALALLWTSLGVLRHAESEEAHLRRLLQESERRKEAEEAVQHLQKMEALGRLSGGVAHDFNNPLTAIIGSLELASARINDPARTSRLIATAMQAAERGARLTAQMLAFSRSQDIAPHPLDINAIIREIEPLIRGTVDALVEVTYSLDEDLWPAIGDRMQFEVALLNLAGNARDAMPLGGKLAVATRNVTPQEAAAAGLSSAEYVQILITDNGEGMSADTKARAFDPFFTTKGVGAGTGLGLSQVYGFADQVGGTAKIRWLPRAVTGAAPREQSQTVAATARSLDVLLVDDDETVRTLIEEMLGELGHRVTSAENGSAAVALLSGEAAFDLLLADFAMPVMNGGQVAAEAIKLRPGLPVLFMTGYADASVLGAWLQAGYRTLKKPFVAADLGRAIRAAMQSPPPGNVVPLRQSRG
jgi:signal transduction histidine kinase/ActR/RegA family two-component response regulator